MMNTKGYAKARQEIKELQTIKDSIGEKKLAKLETFYNEPFTSRQTPASATFITKLAQEWTAWVRQEETVIRTDQFCLFKGIPKGTFYRWVSDFPILKEAHETVRSLIAIRRELGVCIRDAKTGNTKLAKSALIMMHHYDEDWKKSEEWKAKLTQKANNDTSIRVEMVAYPSSPLVPER